MHSHVRTCVMWSPFPDEHLTHTYSCICFISNASLNQEASFGPVAPQGQAGFFGHAQTVQSLNLVCLAGTALPVTAWGGCSPVPAAPQTAHLLLAAQTLRLRGCSPAGPGVLSGGTAAAPGSAAGPHHLRTHWTPPSGTWVGEGGSGPGRTVVWDRDGLRS